MPSRPRSTPAASTHRYSRRSTSFPDSTFRACCTGCLGAVYSTVPFERPRGHNAATLMRIPALLLALCLAADVVWAVDLDDADFGLRFTAAITRFSRYPDVAGMGGASAGSRWSSGINPASTGWSPPVGKRKWGIASQYSHIMFDNGTDVNILSGSAAFETKNSGTFQPAVLGLGSNTATTLQGDANSPFRPAASKRARASPFSDAAGWTGRRTS